MSDPDFEPLPPLREMDADFEPLPSLEEEVLQKDQKLRTLYQLSPPPEQQAEHLEISRKTGVTPEMVAKDPDGFRKVVQAQEFDTEKWRKDNAEAAELADRRPDMAGLVQKDEPLYKFKEAFRAIFRAMSWREQARMELESDISQALFGKPILPEGTKRLPEYGFPEPLIQPPKKVLMQMTPASTGSAFEKVYSAFQQGQTQAEYINLGWNAWLNAARGQDNSEQMRKASALKDQLTPVWYDSNPVEQMAIEAANMLPPMARPLLRSGEGGVAGALLGGGIGAGIGALSRNPGAAAQMAKTGAGVGWKWGRKAGSFEGTFEMETGSFYLDAQDEKTDDGRPLDPKMTMGLAAIYGAVAAAIEVGDESEISAWGPLGDAVRHGTGMKFLKAAAKNASVRAIVTDLTKRIGRGLIGEGLQEASQSAAQNVLTYVDRSISAGALQTPDIQGAVDDIVESGGRATLGAAGLAPFHAAINVVTTMGSAAYERQAAVRDAQKVVAIAKLAEESPTAKADPAEAAKVVKAISEATGRPVENMYVDAPAFMRFFQEAGIDPAEAATSLTGKDGVFAIQEALTTGGKLEVPVERYLERWGPSGAAKALLEHTTASREAPTMASEKELEARVRADAEKLAAEYEGGQDVHPESLAEADFLQAMEDRLARTDVYDKKQARKAMQLWRAFTNTSSSEFGTNPAEAFAFAAASLRQEGRNLEPDTSFNFGENVEQPQTEATAQPPTPEAQQAEPAMDWSSEHKRAEELIGRMRSSEKKAEYRAWLEYALGRTEERPKNISDATKRELANYGVVDPEGFEFDENGRSMRRRIPGKRRATGPEAERQRRIFREEMARRNWKGGTFFQGTPESTPEGALPATDAPRLDGTTEEAQSQAEATGAALKARPEGSSTGRAAPEASLLQDIESTGAPVRPDGTINAAETVLRLYQTRDWRAWLERFRANKSVQKTYAEAELETFGRGLEATAAIFGDFSMLGEEGKGSPLRGNTDPLFRKTWDITTLCPRQDKYVSTINGVEHKLGRILNPFERHLVGVMLREEEVKPACWFCYGQAGRNAYDFAVVKATEIAQKYVALRHTKSRISPAEMEAIFTGEGYKWNPDGRWRQFLDANWKHLEGEGALDAVRLRDIARGMVEASTAFEKELKKAVKGAAQGATRANAPKPWASLKDHFLRNLKPDDVQRFNAIAGLRMNSQTDFRAWHVLEVAEGLAQLRAVGSMLHVYTKEADFLRIFGGTGIKFNLSISYATDEQGRIIRKGKVAQLDDVRGMAQEDVEKYRKKHPRDVGGMLVALNDEQLLEGLADERVDMIIPYHAGSVPRSVDKFEAAHDYSSEQHEDWGKLTKGDIKSVKLSNGKTVQVVVGQPITREHHFNDKNLYLELCRKLDIEPRFSRFVDNPNYMKLVRDVARDPSNQVVVDPRAIDWKAANEVLDRWVKAGGEKADIEADPKLVKYVTERIEKGDWPKGVVTPTGEDVAIEDTLYGEDAAAVERHYQPAGPSDFLGYTDIHKEGFKRLYDIVLSKDANLSTFLHESGHVFLDMYSALAARPDAPARTREKMASILKYLGVEKYEDIKTEHHEKFARAFEGYLMEGKAPSAGLVGAFESFKLWLKSIYRSVAGLGVELNDDIRQTFDRLLATDAEIEKQKAAMGLQPMFRSPMEMAKALGRALAPDEWQSYLDAQEEATAHAARAAELRAMKDKLQAQEEWFKQAQEVERGEADKEFEALPARRARQVLRGKSELSEQPILLDRKTVEALVGEEAAKKFRLKKDGAHPDDVAEQVGFVNGAQMLDAILALPEKGDWVKQRTQERMQSKHPDLLSDREKLRDEVSKGLHGDQTEKWLVQEWDALRSRVKGWNPDVASIKAAAKLLAERRTVGSLQLASALRDERSAAEKAARAVLKKDYGQAAVFKQQQLLNMFLHRELLGIKDEVDVAMNRLRHFTEEKARRQLGKAGANYLEQVDTLLESVELRQSVSMREMDRRASTIAWLEKEHAAGRNPVIPDSVLENLDKTRHWKTLTIGELRDLRDSVENIAKLAHLKTTLLERGERRDFEEAKAELLEKLAALPSTIGALIPKNATAKEKALRAAKSLEATMVRPEELIRRLDGGDESGPWHRLFWEPLSDATYRHEKLVHEVVKPILEEIEKLPAEHRARLREETFVVKGQRVTLEQALSVALNWGNESNADKMLRGGLMLANLGFQNWGPEDFDSLMAKLTREDWELVQRIGNRLEAKWPEVAEMHRRLTGLVPKKVEPRPFARTLADGSEVKLTGWYYPVIYDKQFSGAGAKADEAQALRQFQLFQPGYYEVITPQGHLEKRVEDYARPIDLTLDGLPRRLNEAMKDLAMREAMLSVHSILTDRELSDALTVALGPEKKVLEGVLRDTANDLVIPDGGIGMLQRLASRSRAGTVGAVFAFNVAQTMQNLSGIGNALEQVPVKFMRQGLWRLLHDRGDAIAAAAEMSSEMETRAGHLERDLGEELRTLLEKRSKTDQVFKKTTEIGLRMFVMTDRIVSTATWYAAREHALEALEKGGLGMTEEEAVRHADKVVRTSLAAARTLDLPAFMRAPNWRVITMFAGWANGELNRYLASIHDASTLWSEGQRWRAVKRLWKTWLIMGLVSGLSELMVGHGPQPREDDEDGTAAFARWMATLTFVGPLTRVPFFGTLLKASMSGRDASLTPWTRGLEEGFKAVVEAGKGVDGIVEDDDDAPEHLKRAALLGLSSVAYYKGLPVAQARSTLGYLLGDDFESDIDEGNAAQAAWRIGYGKKKEQSPFERLVSGD